MASIYYDATVTSSKSANTAILLTKASYGDQSIPSGKIFRNMGLSHSSITAASDYNQVIINNGNSTASSTVIYSKSSLLYPNGPDQTINSNASGLTISRFTAPTYLTMRISSALTPNSSGILRVSFYYSDPTLTWSNPTLSLSQSTTSRQVTATMGGTATHESGATVTYYLYEGSTQIGQFSNGTLTFTSTVGSHTYKTVASAGGLTADGATSTITVVEQSLTWSNPSLLLVQSQSSTQVTATMGGTATHSRGLSVTYYLYEGSTQIGTFSNNTITFTATVGSHTYKTIAAAGGLTADGAVTTTTVVGAELYWDGAYLFLVQDPNSLSVTATMGGTATHTFGEQVDYYLYEGSTQVGQFSTSEMTFYASVGEHTYKTVASAGGLTADGAATSISVVEPGPPPLPVSEGTVGYYDGTQFIECEVYRYNGTSYEQMIPYYYDGTDWVECSQ